jgi:hypothetical protein
MIPSNILHQEKDTSSDLSHRPSMGDSPTIGQTCRNQSSFALKVFAVLPLYPARLVHAKPGIIAEPDVRIHRRSGAL